MSLHQSVDLSQASSTAACSYDASSRTLHIRLTKVTPGAFFPGLDTLQAQILSNAEMRALEQDAKFESLLHPTGLLASRSPCGEAYERVAATGRVPYLEVHDPGNLHPAERMRIAKSNESNKWDEGMYLDCYVDPDGEIAAVLDFTPQSLAKTASPPVILRTQLPEARLATWFLLELLFGYAYELRVSFDDPSTESAWTVCKLSRSIACFATPAPAANLESVLCGLYRRALTYPLYRSWALCERVQSDVANLLQTEPQAHIFYAISQLDAWFALAPTSTGVPETVEAVLHVIWEQWVAPLQAWVVHASSYVKILTYTSESELITLGKQLKNLRPAAFKDAVGTPGDWDLVALEEAAHEAMATGEGGGFV